MKIFLMLKIKSALKFFYCPISCHLNQMNKLLLVSISILFLLLLTFCSHHCSILGFSTCVKFFNYLNLIIRRLTFTFGEAITKNFTLSKFLQIRLVQVTSFIDYLDYLPYILQMALKVCY